MRLAILAAAVLAAAPTLAQEEVLTAEDDCARLAETLEEGLLPVPWKDEADEIAEVARAGRSGACLAMFDLIRPSPPTGPADLPPSCIRLRSLLKTDGLPDALEEPMDSLVTAIGAGDADGCARGLDALASAR